MRRRNASTRSCAACPGSIAASRAHLGAHGSHLELPGCRELGGVARCERRSAPRQRQSAPALPAPKMAHRRRHTGAASLTAALHAPGGALRLQLPCIAPLGAFPGTSCAYARALTRRHSLRGAASGGLHAPVWLSEPPSGGLHAALAAGGAAVQPQGHRRDGLEHARARGQRGNLAAHRLARPRPAAHPGRAAARAPLRRRAPGCGSSCGGRACPHNGYRASRPRADLRAIPILPSAVPHQRRRRAAARAPD